METMRETILPCENAILIIIELNATSLLQPEIEAAGLRRFDKNEQSDSRHK